MEKTTSIESNNDGEKETIDGFEELMKKTLASLNIKANTDVFKNIMNKLKEFNKKDQYKIITNLEEEINNLQKADKEIAKLMEEGGPLYFYKESIQDNWDSTMEQLGELQGLILLDKVSGDATAAINGLLEAFSGKMSAVNKILGKKLTSTDKKRKKKETDKEKGKENEEDNTNDPEIETINEELKKKMEENKAIKTLLRENPNTDEEIEAYIDRANELLHTQQVGGSAKNKVDNFKETKKELEEKLKENTELINELTCKINNKTMINNKKCKTKNKPSTNCDISGLLNKVNGACATEEKAAIDDKCIKTNSELLKIVDAECNSTSSQPTTQSVPLSNAPSQDCNTTDLTNKANDACATEEKAAIDDKCIKANSELLHKINEACVVEKIKVADKVCVDSNTELLRNISGTCKPATSSNETCNTSSLINTVTEACAIEKKAAIENKCIMTNSELLMTNAVCTTTPLVTQPTTSVPLSAHSQDCNTTDLTNNTNNACIGEKITALDNKCIKTNSELLSVVNAACTPTQSTPSAASATINKYLKYKIKYLNIKKRSWLI
jgi:predicted Zn-dependent protease with MMP-like domain